MAEVLCPSCGSLSPATASECPECGTSLFSSDERTHIKARVVRSPADSDANRTLDTDAIEDDEPTNAVTPSATPPPQRRSAISDSTIPFRAGVSLGTLPIRGDDVGQAVLPPPSSPGPPRRSSPRAQPIVTERGTPAVQRELKEPPTTNVKDAPTPQLLEKPDGLPPDTQPGLQAGPSGKRDLLTGTRLGEYVVEERVGIGGMGIVYRAVQPMIGNSVAIKVLRPDVIVDESDMQRFLGEARTVNSIRHRSIISIFGAGDTPDGRKYLVMEFLEGESLEARLQREGRLASADAVPILEDVLSALAAAHASNVVHRDLKPANVFLVQQSDGRPWVKLLDFGLARRSSQDVSRIAGTPDYISPEHARGKPAGPAADLYGFGVMAFHLLTGRLPFPGNTPMEVMEQHVHKAPPVPAEVDSTIPPALSELIIRLLAKDPAVRPEAKTVKADLKAAVKQLRAAQTQIGHVPGMGGVGMNGTVVREVGTRPETQKESAVRVDPRLEQLAIDADRASVQAIQAATTRPGGSALARNWPWLAGGLALAWLLAVAIYVLLTPTPTPRTDALPIPPPGPQAPLPPPEPENAPDVTGEPPLKADPVKTEPPKVDPHRSEPSRADPPPIRPKKHGK